MADDATDLVVSDLYALITYLHLSANRDLFDAIGTCGLSFSQLMLLERLRGGRYSPTIRQASMLLHMTPQGGGQVIAALRKRGLVHFLPDQIDRRQRRIVITEKGEQEVARLHAARLEEVSVFVEQLDAGELAELAGALSLVDERDAIAAHRPRPLPA